MNIKLVELSPIYKEQLFEMMDEWVIDVKNNPIYHSPRIIFMHDYHNFDVFCNSLDKLDTEYGRVPCSTFFCLDLDRDIFVGAVCIRHYLNEELIKFAGHIGDGIRPSERGKGYGTAMIKLALTECKKLGIMDVLMCCLKDNLASKKTIINNGGKLENEISKDGQPLQRYWIKLHD